MGFMVVVLFDLQVQGLGELHSSHSMSSEEKEAS